MPSGYTAPVQDGDITTLAEFAAKCAHGMGAFIHMRDDGIGAELRMPEKYDYFERAYNDKVRERNAWARATEEERYAQWSEYAEETEAHLAKAKADSERTRERYEAMLAKVEAVDAPDELAGFQEFMIKQLKDSIDFDCHDYDDQDSFLVRYFTVQDYVTWCNKHTEDLDAAVQRRHEDVIKEEQRHAERIEYIRLLQETYGFEVKS